MPFVSRFYIPMSKTGAVLAFISFGILFTAMGGMAIREVITESNLTSRLDSEGVRTSAIVVEHYDYSGKIPTLHLDYEVNGVRHSKWIDVTAKDYFQRQDGSTTQIAYLKEDPEQVRLVGSTYVHTPKSFAAIGGVTALIGFALIGYGLHYAKTAPPDTAID